MKRFSYLLVSVLTTFCACQNNDFEEYSNSNEVVVTANIASSTNTRVALTPTTNDEGNPIVKVEWNDNGESFRVYGANENMVLTDHQTFTQVAENRFSGTLPETSNQNYWATYPANDNVWATNSPFLPVSYNDNLFTTQNGKLSEEKTVMFVWTIATEEIPNFNFEHLTTLLKPNFKIGEEALTANAISSIVFKDMLIEDGNTDFNIDCTSHQEGDEIYVYLPADGGFGYGNSEYDELSYKNFIDVVVNTKNGKIYEGRINIPSNMFLETGKLYTATISLELSPYCWTYEVEASQEVSGSGSSESPYLISTAADLQWLVENVATNNNDESISKGMYYKLMHDLVICSSEDNPWTAIGDEYTKFQGIFDGNEHTISGSLVSAYTVNSYGDDVNFGLFGYLGESAIVKNLHLNLNVKGGNTKNDRRSPEHSTTGVLAGCNYGLITDCTTKGLVQGGNATADVNISHTGGVVGFNQNKMVNCTNYATVKGGQGTTCYTGGIAGRFGEQYAQNGSMDNCINHGTVIGGNIGGSEAGGTGGITGYRHYYGTMKACVNNGSITAASGNSYTGGVVGRLDQDPSICSCNKDNSNSGLPIIGSGQDPIECEHE